MSVSIMVEDRNCGEPECSMPLYCRKLCKIHYRKYLYCGAIEPLPTKDYTGTGVWTISRVAELELLHNQGLGPSEIARRMDLTKGQVIGKSDRLGFCADKPLSPMERLDHLSALLPAPGSCLFGHGNRGEPGFHFCATKVARFGLPYCDEHMKRAYQIAPQSETRRFA